MAYSRRPRRSDPRRGPTSHRPDRGRKGQFGSGRRGDGRRWSARGDDWYAVEGSTGGSRPDKSRPDRRRGARNEGAGHDGAGRGGAGRHGAGRRGAHRSDADWYSPDRYSGDRRSAHQYGDDRYGADRRGADRNQDGRSGMDQDGADRRGARRRGATGHGSDRFDRREAQGRRRRGWGREEWEEATGRPRSRRGQFRYRDQSHRHEQSRREEPPRRRESARQPHVAVDPDRAQPRPRSGVRFSELGVPRAMTEVLDGQGITTAFPIQAAAIPDAMAGRDLLGRGQTGSGKTLAFGLPLLTRLDHGGASSEHPRALCLAPTRELAMQVHDVLRPLAEAMGMRTVLVAGGMSYTPQLRALRRGVDLVVATPGRFVDLMGQGAARLDRVETVVLDEADEMAELGFMEEITRVLDELPDGAQHLLFSATLDGQVDELVERYLDNPAVHGVDSAQASVTTMRHEVWRTDAREKRRVIAQAVNRPGRTIVFVRTQRTADEMAEWLREAGVMAGALHGGLPQGLRARVLHAFREGTVPVLVATDVAARGIDVDDVSLVLQADPPRGGKDYLHRAGRTARAGEAGLVVSLVLPRQRRRMEYVLREAGVSERPHGMHPGERVTELTGGVRPEAEPVTTEQYKALIAPTRPPRGQGGRRGFRRGREPRRRRGRGGH